MNGYHTFCTKCGKGYGAYDDSEYGVMVDGKFYCRDCAPLKRVEGGYVDKSIIRDIRNIASLWDGPPLFYTSMGEFLEAHTSKYTETGKVKIIKIVEKPDVFDLIVPSKLSGKILGEHYNILIYKNYPGDEAGWYCEGYVYDMREDMKGYPMEVRE